MGPTACGPSTILLAGLLPRPQPAPYDSSPATTSCSGRGWSWISWGNSIQGHRTIPRPGASRLLLPCFPGAQGTWRALGSSCSSRTCGRDLLLALGTLNICSPAVSSCGQQAEALGPGPHPLPSWTSLGHMPRLLSPRGQPFSGAWASILDPFPSRPPLSCHPSFPSPQQPQPEPRPTFGRGFPSEQLGLVCWSLGLPCITDLILPLTFFSFSFRAQTMSTDLRAGLAEQCACLRSVFKMLKRKLCPPTPASWCCKCLVPILRRCLF